MGSTPKVDDNVLGQGQNLRRAAWPAVGFGAVSALLDGVALLAGDWNLIHAALACGLLGDAISLCTLGAAILARSRCQGELIGQVSVLLPIPFILIQPVCHFQALGLGLGGDAGAVRVYGAVGAISLYLAPITFIIALVAAVRSCGPSETGR